ncbi:NifB/NifX family molybdenum-iron cluster-binding protein [Methanobacterium spitsbergense]|uniref:Dinitrogenase iron-molybdenum cofactor biosynthesis protein n=1 Tax=Methanobacterium spitsbergense TaxID=2874285 RepID=A0A8T5V0V0_9EURY|nr:NifB/NifX family molybdenum-iron cluster-binding protein [Methanobacterium spitsbergense]MBZ2166609.1 dinitrogenase iron-molybdenum cofactor biosynthesis protein [Methanobacterium spitsbergense]
MLFRVAIASNDGKIINQHFGHAKQFLIFDIDDNGDYEYIELRENIPTCSGGNHTAASMESTLKLIKDVDIVLVSQIGPGASQSLISIGIQPYIMPMFIDEALEKLVSKFMVKKRQLKRENLNNIK